MSLAVASRYARALADVVTAPGSALDPSAVLTQLRDFQAALESSGDLRNVMASPAIPPARKRAVIARLAEPMGLHEKVKNFFYVVVDHRRLDVLGGMAEAFEAVMDERLGRVRADVTSAKPLSGAQKESLAAELARVSGRQVRCEFHTDESLLGGAAARIGSTVYDGTVRGRLEGLRRRLAG